MHYDETTQFQKRFDIKNTWKRKDLLFVLVNRFFVERNFDHIWASCIRMSKIYESKFSMFIKISFFIKNTLIIELTAIDKVKTLWMKYLRMIKSSNHQIIKSIIFFNLIFSENNQFLKCYVHQDCQRQILLLSTSKLKHFHEWQINKEKEIKMENCTEIIYNFHFH
jgi:hypothetical protein